MELTTTQRKSMVGRARAFLALTQTVTSQLLSRMQLSNRAGLTFGGKRDMYRVFGYDTVLHYYKYVARFMRNGMAYRVVTAYPHATWRNAPSVFDTDDSKRDSPFEEAWDAIVKKFNLFSVFERLDILANLGEYAILLIGAPGKASIPLTKLRKLDDLLYLAPYGQGAATIQTVETNTQDPHFGLPTIYKLGGVDLTHLNIAQPLPAAGIDTHYTRIFHVAEGILEGSLYGTPRLQPVWNYLDDLDKVTGGSGEAFWQKGNRGMNFKLDPETDFEDQQAELQDEIQEYVHDFKRYMITQGVDAQDLGGTPPDPTGAFNTAIQCISGTTGIPQRILLGSEAGQLASTQDRDNWNERITERRTAFAEPSILRPFIDRMIEIGILPKPKDDTVQINWPDLMAYSAESKSQMALRESVAMSNYANAVTKGVKLIASSEARKRWFGLPSEMPDDPNEDEFLQQQPIPSAGGGGQRSPDPNIDPNNQPAIQPGDATVATNPKPARAGGRTKGGGRGKGGGGAQA